MALVQLTQSLITTNGPGQSLALSSQAMRIDTQVLRRRTVERCTAILDTLNAARSTDGDANVGVTTTTSIDEATTAGSRPAATDSATRGTTNSPEPNADVYPNRMLSSPYTIS